MPLKERLDEELKDVSFSEEQRQQLKTRLLLAVEEQRRRPIRSFWKQFWHGYTEVPLPVALAVFLMVAVGLGRSLYGALAVDHTQAALILQTAGESLRVLNQGVSVL